MGHRQTLETSSLWQRWLEQAPNLSLADMEKIVAKLPSTSGGGSSGHPPRRPPGGPGGPLGGPSRGPSNGPPRGSSGQPSRGTQSGHSGAKGDKKNRGTKENGTQKGSHEIKQGFDGSDRHVSLRKDASGKLGLRVKALDTGCPFKQFLSSILILLEGAFVSMVMEGSPAAKEGLRLGDQILEVDQANLAGWNSEQVIFSSLDFNLINVKVHNLLAKKPFGSAIKMIIRKRPFVRRCVLQKVTFHQR